MTRPFVSFTLWYANDDIAPVLGASVAGSVLDTGILLTLSAVSCVLIVIGVFLPGGFG